MFISLQTLEVIPDLRNPVYMTSCFKAVNLDVILQLMSKVSWDVRDVKSQHSQYVDVLLRVSNIWFMLLMYRVYGELWTILQVEGY